MLHTKKSTIFVSTCFWLPAFRQKEPRRLVKVSLTVNCTWVFFGGGSSVWEQILFKCLPLLDPVFIVSSNCFARVECFFLMWDFRLKRLNACAFITVSLGLHKMHANCNCVLSLFTAFNVKYFFKCGHGCCALISASITVAVAPSACDWSGRCDNPLVVGCSSAWESSESVLMIVD